MVSSVSYDHVVRSQQIIPKRPYTSAELHGVISHTTATLTVIPVQIR